MKAHIDINIFMDVLTRRAAWPESFSLIDSLQPHKVAAYVSAMTIAILHFLRARDIGEMRARAEVKAITQDFRIIPLTRPILLAALASPLPEFEDNIQFYSARKMRGDYIITRNKKHFLQDEIPVVTPEEFLKVIGVLR